MDPLELQRLQTLYREMDDQGLSIALYQGPEAYRAPAVWKIIAEEASRRGIAVPNHEEHEAHWEAERAEAAASEPPPIPLGWRLFIVLVGSPLYLLGWKSLGAIVSSLVERPDGWLANLRLNTAILACVCVAFLLLRLQIERLRERTSRNPE
jgi:hypothetical protein